MLVASHLCRTARRLARHAVKAALLIAALAALAPQAAAQWTPGTEYMASTLGAGSYFDAPTFDGTAVGSGAMSIEAWVNLGSGADAGIVQLQNAFGNSMSLYTVWDAGSSNHRLFYKNTNGPSAVDFEASTRITPGTWTHVVGSYDSDDAFVFVNGTSTTDGSWSGDFGDGNRLFTTNTWGRTTATGSTLDLVGQTSGLRVWRSSITPTTTNSVVNFDLSGAGATLRGNFQVGTNGDTTPLVGSPVGGSLTAQGASVGYTKNGTGTVTVTVDDFQQGPITIEDGTLALGNNGTAGWLSGNVTNSGTLSFNRSDARDFTGVISGTGAVTKLASSKLTLSGAKTYTGATNVSAGTLSLTGNIASAATVATGATFEGNGISTGSIAGAGSVAPGINGSTPDEGILTFSSLDPSANTSFDLEFTANDPTYSDATNSGNDLIRLTAATGFDAAMTSANVINIYLNVDSLTWGDEFRGGFFTDTRSNFISSLQDATVNYFLKDAGGATTYNGVNYNDVSSLDWILQTAPATATFAGGTVNGQVLQVVPEPSSFALAGFAIAGLAAAGYRRRKAAAKKAA